jgi:hypothetical protein
MGSQGHASATLLPFYRRLGGSQGRLGRVREHFLTQGFKPKTVQSVEQLYLLRYPGPRNIPNVNITCSRI